MAKKFKTLFSFASLKKDKSYSFYPQRDWVILVVVFFIVNIILITLLIFNYLRIVNDQGSFAEENYKKYDSIDNGALQSVLDKYKQKEIDHQNLLEKVPRISDPAI